MKIISKKPSLSDFMIGSEPSKASIKRAKAANEGVVKNLTLRTSFGQWEAMIALTTSERTKIQHYLLALIEADFASRGLRWPE
jgi:hypothetical protein